eukprot:139057_1
MAAYDDDGPFHQHNTEQMSTPITPNPTPVTPPTPSSSGLFAEGVKEGWVLKKGPQSLHGWKKRYLQLSRTKHLAYYTDESMVKRKGTVFLSALSIHHIQRSAKASDSKHHGFCIKTSGRTYLFCTGSATDRDHWIQKIREVVDEHWDAHKISKKSISISMGPGQYPKMPHKASIISASVNVNRSNRSSVGSGGADQRKDSSHEAPFENASGDWDDDDEISGPGVTLEIMSNMLKNKNKNKGNAFDFATNSNKPMSIMTEEEEVLMQDEEAQAQIDRLEESNDRILDKALQTSYETQQIAADTAQKLDDQRQQLTHIDKDLHEIDQDLDKTEGILDGMKSWKGMIKKKLGKNKKRDEYTATADDKSTFERKERENGMNHVGNGTQIPDDADSKQNDKLDELLNNIKGLNQQAHDINTELEEQNVIIDAIGDKMDKVQPRLQQQNKTMKKICD